MQSGRSSRPRRGHAICSRGARLRPLRSPRCTHATVKDAVGLVVVLTVVLVLPTLYVGAERNVYMWDNAGFQERALRAAASFQQSTGEGLRHVQSTLGRDYNALFAVLLLPFLQIFGDSRIAYVLAVALVYQLPFVLVVGRIGVRLIVGPTRPVFWSTVGVALCLPATWVPVLRGFPDTGGALLVALAILAYLTDAQLRRWWQVPCIGLLLSAAVLFRRHFLIIVPAFVAAAMLATLADAVLAARGRWRVSLVAVARAIGRLIAAMACGIAGIALFAQPFLGRLSRDDFYELYSGYMQSPGTVTSFFAGCFGAAVLAAAAVGLAGAIRSPVVRFIPALFLFLLGTLAAGEWIVIVRQTGDQYSLHFTAIVILGVAACGWSLLTVAPKRMAIGGSLLLAGLGFGLSGTAAGWIPELLRSAAPRVRPPLVRGDLDALRGLVDDLRARVQPDDRIFVAASSPMMSSDLLRRAEIHFYGRDTKLNVLLTPEVDSADSYPIRGLLRATYVVIVRPLQLHLDASQQNIVSVVYRMFDRREAVAGDFEPIPKTYRLDPNGVVAVLRRLRPSSFQTGLATIGLIEKAVPRPSDSQPDWVVVSQTFPSWIEATPDGGTRIAFHPSPPLDSPPAVVMHLPRRYGPVRVVGRIELLDARCMGITLEALVGSADVWRSMRSVWRRPDQESAFELRLDIPKGDRIALRIGAADADASIDFCLTRIELRAIAPRAQSQ
jgi:hypothetical protein